MKTFAFIPTQSIKNTYDSILIKYKRQDFFMDMTKIWLLLVVLIFTFFIYLIYVSKSSTRWYFLRKENQTLNEVSFQYEILKAQMLEQKQINWDKINTDQSKREVVTINTEVVRIPTMTELSMK